MDSKQKEKITRVQTDLAEVIDFNQTSARFESEKLIPECIIRDLKTKKEFSRNFRLLNALMDSKALNAYDKFIDILDELGLDEALDLLEPDRVKKENKGIRFRQSLINSKLSKVDKPPIGIFSGHVNDSPIASNSSRLTFSPPDNKSSNYDDKNYRSSPLSKFAQQLKDAPAVTVIKQNQHTVGPHVNQNDDLMKRHGRAGNEIQMNQRTQKSCASSDPRIAGGKTQMMGSGGKTCAVKTTSSSLERAAKQIQLLYIDDDNLNHEASNESQEYINSTNNHHHNANTFYNTPTIQQDSQNFDEPSSTQFDEALISFHPYESANEQSSPTTSLAGSLHRYHESDASSMESAMSVIDINHHVTSEISNYPELLKTMEVRKATKLRYNVEDDYKMTAKPRGPCLIVNNVDFEGDIFPTRRGSDNDATRFDTIFQQLGFQITYKRNLTADQMREAFKELAKSCRIEHDSVFVFILSHGSEHGIYGTDGMEVDLDREVLTCFDNRHCKAMIGKPKVFVIQACRGMSKDCGGVAGGSIGEGDSTDAQLGVGVWSSVTESSKGGAPPSVVEPLQQQQQQQPIQNLNQINRVPSTWLPQSHSGRDADRKRKHPVRTDMLIVFSCLAGYVSIRNETAGSWLGVALAYFIMTHSCERDLIRILNLVTSDVIQRESSHGHIQSIELKLLGWTKNLYLNPGQYEK